MEESAAQPESTPTPPRGGLRIEKDFIETLPVGEWQGSTEVIENLKDTQRAVAALSQERILGFDTETKPSHTPGEYNLPSILQLAGEKHIFIFRLDQCGGIPLTFPILCNARQAKVGVAVRDDVKNLRARAPFDAAGFLDISDFTRKAGVENTGLRALAAHYLGLQMKKSKKVQCSNWARPLDERQIAYAANDAWFSRQLYLELEKRGIVPPF